MTIKLITAFVLAFLFATAFGKFYVPWLRRIKAGQEIKENGPSWHMSKSGTPTMGGVMFILAAILVCLTVCFEGMLRGEFVNVFIVLFACVFGAIGFLDDWEKLAKKQNLGLSATAKFLLQLVASLVFVLLMRQIGYVRPSFYLFFVDKTIYMPEWLYFLISSFIIVGTVNAVNITDGIDGLAASTSIPVFLFFVALTLVFGDEFEQMGFIASGMVGGLLGFLVYNFNPAKCFMGDTGSILGSFLYVACSEWWLRFLDNPTVIGTFKVPLLGHRFLRVHARRRLIQDQQAGVGGQRAGDLQPALLSVGQAAGLLAFLVRQPHDLQKLHRLPAHPGFLLAVQAEGRRQKAAAGVHMLGDQDVFKDRQVAEQADILEGTGQTHLGDLVRRFAQCGLVGKFFGVAAQVFPLAAALGVLAQVGLAVQVQAAVGGGVYAGHRVKGRRLAGAVGSDQGNDLSLPDLHRKVVDSHYAAELHRDIFQPKNGVIHSQHRLSPFFCRRTAP